jgi:hypothetical protein
VKFTSTNTLLFSLGGWERGEDTDRLPVPLESAGSSGAHQAVTLIEDRETIQDCDIEGTRLSGGVPFRGDT